MSYLKSLLKPENPKLPTDFQIKPFKDKNNSTARILSTKWSNYEIGKISGGKPFTLNTYIDYLDKFYKGYFRGPYDNQDFKPEL